MEEKIDNLLERKDNKSIAKMIKKVKNSNCGSPSKALVFQPKNLNQHLDTKPPKKDTGIILSVSFFIPVASVNLATVSPKPLSLISNSIYV